MSVSDRKTLEPIQIRDRLVGPGHPAYIVAEIGINHNGDMALAKKAINAAAKAGADSVKFQNYLTEDFVSDRELTYSYETYKKGRLVRVTERQWDMFKRCELTRANLQELLAHCRRRGISMHSTPTSRKGIDDLLRIGVPALKNGSDYLPNLDLVRAMGVTGLPTVLSTGMATVTEIDEAVATFRATGNSNLIVLHCTSSYPTPDDEVNIRRVQTIRDTWGVLSGFSDHSEGISAAVLSVVYGACWIEKHFTLDKTLLGPDHRFSMDPAELKALVQAVRAAEKQIGTATLGPTPSETESRARFRLSCVAADDVRAGTILTKEHVAFRRPGTGLRPALAELLIGRKLKKALQKGQLINNLTDFE